MTHRPSPDSRFSVYTDSILCTVVDSSNIKMCGTEGKEAGIEMRLLGTPLSRGHNRGGASTSR